MAKNPKIVVDAILDSDGKEVNNIKIYPMTIRRYAWFEKLNSPFINSEVKFDVNGVIPSVYVMCKSKDELKKYNSNDIEKPFHFMTGAELSFSTPGLITITIPTIFEFTLLNFNKTMIELQLNPNLGIGFGIKGGVYFFYNPSIDVTFGRKDRKWFFGGAGIGFVTSGYSYIYEGYGKQENIFGALGLHVVVGLRFP